MGKNMTESLTTGEENELEGAEAGVDAGVREAS